MAHAASQPIYNALIRRSIDLRALHCDAAAQVREPGLRALLGENAQVLAQLVDELQGQVRRRGGEPAQRGKLIGRARRQLAGWLPAALAADEAWIRRLAHDEAALLRAFERGIAAAPADAALELRRLLPRLRDIDLDMRSLVHAGGRC
ncbi:DUF2383 domain-containing protein [Fulvimonas soli]|uniref:Uncharacterized protein (TIGR02284 family) n=1 Tax=Fulvimonas soli TaxID=155197 RepID=A0A316HWS5_9GAMM|nr:DUF2383 domain-containing protein [Fulvimonas soli]PWK85906.1 uncharacterized protein (TIGR02284 family) [Fulvimonas soli]TNY25958.1 hypothetical protein BV497_11205 [Fulvimonas soli]